MEHFSTEEEQIAAIKKFWKENGIAIVVGTVLGLGGLWGWRYYNEQVMISQEQASDAYNQAVESLNGDDGFANLQKFVEEKSDSSYAALAALQLAKEAVEREDYPEAQKQLNWVVANVSSNPIKEVALIRLARVQNETEDYTGALQSLDKVTSEAYKAQVLSIKGDVYQNQGEYKLAQDAYKNALELEDTNSVLQMKIDDLNAKING